MRLYSYWRSTSSWRVRLALQLKGLAYEVVPVNLLHGEQTSAVHRYRNPMAQVPVLELDDGRTLAQSVAIIEYLEELQPEPHLWPEDPWQRSRARQIVEMVNAGIQPLQNLALLNALQEAGVDRAAWARRWIDAGLTTVQQMLEVTAGNYCIGDRVTAADLFVVPQLYNARRFRVDLTPHATLTRVEAACAILPAFIAAHPDAQPDAVTNQGS